MSTPDDPADAATLTTARDCGTIDAYDVQEILRCLELAWTVTREVVPNATGTQPDGIYQIGRRWKDIMERAGIDRYGDNGQQIRLMLEPLAGVAKERTGTK